MQKIINLTLVTLVFICLLGGRVAAQENSIPLLIEPIYPDNQIGDEKGYFHLLTEPGQEITVAVELTNQLDTELHVEIEPANAFTNPSGGMLYGQTIDSDQTILLEDAIKLAPHIEVESNLTLQPNETREIPVSITVPDADTGTILGGIRIITAGNPIEKSEEAQEDEANFILNTEIVNSIAIQLDLPTKTEPNYTLGDVSFNPDGPSVTIEMTNDAQHIQEDVRGNYQIKTVNGEVLFEGTINPFKMAPKSRIQYPILWNYKTIESGTYHASLVMQANDTKLELEEDFTIGDGAIQDYVERTQPIATPEPAEKGIPIWLWIILGVILAGVMYWLGKRNKK
ncbi:DUF916 domain-containing protein [Ornithinibacillus contaminans]|uniref:DUF916 domain-containing protein n=1 Tax=Ornithinibacillus contaminans TaxID=694055 RepID=UPI00064DCE81|nr:DUF916 domain-containing protein [Ornithinibacillus contaminans]